MPIKPVHINRRTKKPTAAHWKWAIACCIGLFMTGPALSAGRIALLIGNQKYTYHKPLENPERDVDLVADALKRLGFVPKVLKNAGRAAMVEAIDEFVAESSGKDVALFYYAGHGMQPLEGGRNFLLPVDARRVSKDSILSADGVVADATGGIVQKLERLPTPARMRLVLLDACRNNPRSGRNHRDSDRGMTPTMPEDLYTLVSYSTSEAAPAKDDVNGSKHSPYAQAVARLLPKASVRSVRDVFDEISLEVRRATGGEQEPGIYSKLPGNILLSGRNQELSPAQREADAWYEAQSINTPEALRAFLEAFPNGQYATIATIRLKGLIRPADPPAPRPGDLIKDCSVCPELVLLPTGSFMMGSPDNEKDRSPDEGPVHKVTLSRPIAVGRFEVSRGEFAAFVARSNYKTDAERGDGCWGWNGKEWKSDAKFNWRNLGFAQTDDHPVVCVSWNDAQAYVKWLNDQHPSLPAGKKFRLLTEAEWEYSARASQGTQRFPWGDDLDYSVMCRWSNVADQTTKKEVPITASWAIDCNDNHAYTAPGGAFPANAFGLHNLHGNAWEWVQDRWHDNYNGAPSDGQSWEAGSDERRVLRGGSWSSHPRILRSARRYWFAPGGRSGFSGFRVARTF